MMNANISTDELKLLAYMHEHATGYTENFSFDAAEVCVELTITEEQFNKDLSYLASHGLAGMSTADASTYGELNSFILTGVWLTGDGENYMREVEAQVEKNEPGKFKKIGMKAVEIGGDLVKAVAIKVLTDKLSRH